ncbi:hypothetical protein A5678_06880 [Mycobacterium sp. E2733]|nr:hypothetical protein A5678_06880 [Mycobacterium sp. E2733]
MQALAAPSDHLDPGEIAAGLEPGRAHDGVGVHHFAADSRDRRLGYACDRFGYQIDLVLL